MTTSHFPRCQAHRWYIHTYTCRQNINKKNTCILKYAVAIGSWIAGVLVTGMPALTEDLSSSTHARQLPASQTVPEDLTPSSGFCGQLQPCAATRLNMHTFRIKLKFKKVAVPRQAGDVEIFRHMALHVRLSDSVKKKAKGQLHDTGEIFKCIQGRTICYSFQKSYC